MRGRKPFVRIIPFREIAEWLDAEHCIPRHRR